MTTASHRSADTHTPSAGTPTRAWRHMRGSTVVEYLNLTDEQAIDMLTHNWNTHHQHLVPDGWTLEDLKS